MIEHEVKLAFDTLEAARTAVHTAGGRLLLSPRLQHDRLFAGSDGRFRSDGSTLRLRRDGDRAFVTFKGPVQGGDVKSREETETTVGDADTFEAILRAAGFAPWFRYEKRREEYALGSARVAIDETPLGVFVEIEGPPPAILDVTISLGRTSADYIRDSYRALWLKSGAAADSDMLFS